MFVYGVMVEEIQCEETIPGEVSIIEEVSRHFFFMNCYDGGGGERRPILAAFSQKLERVATMMMTALTMRRCHPSEMDDDGVRSSNPYCAILTTTHKSRIGGKDRHLRFHNSIHRFELCMKQAQRSQSSVKNGQLAPSTV